jgi:chromodomain-helicase-DNA-binding protein 4
MQLRQRGPKAKNNTFVDISTIGISSSEEEEEDEDELASTSRRPRNGRVRALRRGGGGSARSGGHSLRARSSVSDLNELSTSDDSEAASRKRRRRRKQDLEPTRRSSRQQVPVKSYDNTEEDEDEDEESSESDILRSDVLPGRKRKGRSLRSLKPEKIPRSGVRQSDRSTRAQNNMEEAGMGDVFRFRTQGRSTKVDPSP